PLIFSIESLPVFFSTTPKILYIGMKLNSTSRTFPILNQSTRDLLIIPVENMEMFNIKIPIKNKNKNDIILLILLVLNAPILPANIQIKVITIKNIDI
ncbi:unnamed protein product, partial [marine sediment metagenome]